MFFNKTPTLKKKIKMVIENKQEKRRILKTKKQERIIHQKNHA